MKGPNLRKDMAPAGTFEAATDLLIDKLERQVERARDKRTLERRRRAQHDVLATPLSRRLGSGGVGGIGARDA